MDARVSRVFAFPAGRRSKLVVVGVWVALLFICFAADLPAKFTDAEQNDSASFLPGDAESTEALDVTQRLQGGDVAPTVIVYRREEGLSAEDRSQIDDDVETLNAATQEFENTTPFGKPQLSEDGTPL